MPYARRDGDRKPELTFEERIAALVDRTLTRAERDELLTELAASSASRELLARVTVCLAGIREVRR